MTSSGTDSSSYVDPSTAGYTTETFDANTMNDNQQLSNQVVWKYHSQSYLTLFSQWGSSAQRLPNGDTLICSTVNGYMVEVNSSGNVVWEYINPVTNAGIVTAIGDCLPMTNAVPRATRYAASFAGFQGHTLTPGATIAGTVYPTIAGHDSHARGADSLQRSVGHQQITDATASASATLTYTTGSGTGTTTTAVHRDLRQHGGQALDGQRPAPTTPGPSRATTANWPRIATTTPSTAARAG